MPFSIPFDGSYYDTIILMHCTFADPKLLCGGTDGGPVLYDVKSQALGPVLHIPFQTIHSPPCGGLSYAGRG